MAAFANIAILDSSATPESPGTPAAATRTFVPGGKEGNVWVWYENTTGTTPATRSKLTASLSAGEEVARLKITLATPKAQTVDGVTKVAHVTRAFMEFILPVNGSRDDRKDIAVLVMNALSAAALWSMLSDLEGLAA